MEKLLQTDMAVAMAAQKSYLTNAYFYWFEKFDPSPGIEHHRIKAHLDEIHHGLFSLWAQIEAINNPGPVPHNKALVLLDPTSSPRTTISLGTWQTPKNPSVAGFRAQLAAAEVALLNADDQLVETAPHAPGVQAAWAVVQAGLKKHSNSHPSR